MQRRRVRLHRKLRERYTVYTAWRSSGNMLVGGVRSSRILLRL